MLNNRLNASYIKDVLRFMEMYHIKSTRIRLKNKVDIIIHISIDEDKEEIYTMVAEDLNDITVPFETISFSLPRQEFLKEFKNCQYYMNEVLG